MTTTDPKPSKKYRRITQVMLVVTVAVLVIWDVIVALTAETGDTISESARDYSVYPVLPALVGGLSGHFFFWEARLVPGLWGMAAAIGMLLLIAAWSVLVKNHTGPEWLATAHQWASRHPIVVVGATTVIGGIFWGLAPSTKTM
jgi:hypothetical protein